MERLNDSLTLIADLLSATDCVEVAWLYGSRATGQYTAASDYDVAVALTAEPSEWSDIVEDVRYDLSIQLDATVSVVNINKIPVPLAQNVIACDWVLVCKSQLRLQAEQQRVWSLWAEYKYEHEHNRQPL